MTSLEDLAMENKTFFLRAIGVIGLIFALTTLVVIRFFWCGLTPILEHKLSAVRPVFTAFLDYYFWQYQQ